MQVIINSSVIADGVTDFQASCVNRIVLLHTESLFKADDLEKKLINHKTSYKRFGGDKDRQFEITCNSISANV